MPVSPALEGPRARLVRWLAGTTPGYRRQLQAMLAGVTVLYTAHTLAYAWPQPWFIEDSAISFAYARNLVQGDGLVAFAGGERVEGYSNPTWTLLIALAWALGVDPWISAKVLGWVLGVVALFACWGLVRRAVPEHADRPWILAAPTMLAASTQFVMWNASGLENSLFCALLGVGILRLASEATEERPRPWSALCFFLLSATRPDGLAYVAVAVFARVVASARSARQARREGRAVAPVARDLLAWGLVLVVPWAAYQAWRWWYFAWPWPNTYYAKEKAFAPLNWNGAGWKYVKDYVTRTQLGWALPVVALGAAGTSGRRRAGVLALTAACALVTLWDGRSGLPDAVLGRGTLWLSGHWDVIRIATLVGAAALVGLVSLTAPGWLVRGSAWASLCAGVFFAVWSGGDWMKGYRWFSLTSVPLFTLLGAGLVEGVAGIPWAEAARALRVGARAWTLRAGTVLVVAAVAGVAAPNAAWTRTYLEKPETQPRDIRKRVNYMRWVQARLGLEDVTLLDVDMGAHLWYTDWRILDIAGLVDVPVAHHTWQRPFATEYVFEEERPDFAHVHGAWARTSKLSAHPRWQDAYVEIPGYPSGKTSLHVGNHVRRDLLVAPGWSGDPASVVRFGDDARGVEMLGLALPAPAVEPGGELVVETHWRVVGRRAGFRALVFLHDPVRGTLRSFEVAPAYDWLPVARWRTEEVGRGHYALRLPKDLPKGTYDVGVVVIGEDGAVLPSVHGAGGAAAPPATPPLPGSDTDGAVAAVVAPASDPAPAVAHGEWRRAGAVEIVDGGTARARADARLQDARARADAGDCDGVADAWRAARQHVSGDAGWVEGHAAEARALRVGCWLARGADASDPLVRGAAWARAVRIDPRDARLRDTAQALAAQLDRDGDARASASDHPGAYERYALAMKLDPQRSWTRRKAEKARDAKLGLTSR